MFLSAVRDQPGSFSARTTSRRRPSSPASATNWMARSGAPDCRVIEAASAHGVSQPLYVGSPRVDASTAACPVVPAPPAAYDLPARAITGHPGCSGPLGAGPRGRRAVQARRRRGGKTVRSRRGPATVSGRAPGLAAGARARVRIPDRDRTSLVPRGLGPEVTSAKESGSGAGGTREVRVGTDLGFRRDAAMRAPGVEPCPRVSLLRALAIVLFFLVAALPAQVSWITRSPLDDGDSATPDTGFGIAMSPDGVHAYATDRGRPVRRSTTTTSRGSTSSPGTQVGIAQAQLYPEDPALTLRRGRRRPPRLRRELDHGIGELPHAGARLRRDHSAPAVLRVSSYPFGVLASPDQSRLYVSTIGRLRRRRRHRLGPRERRRSTRSLTSFFVPNAAAG